MRKIMASVKWTDEQQAAIDKKGSNILVAAAAGSGKTAVLVERIIKKIIVDRVDIDKILVVTFIRTESIRSMRGEISLIFLSWTEEMSTW